MTPTSGHPAFRVYTVDPVTFGILDIETYIANISSPTYQSGPTWEKLYSAKDLYGSLVTPPLTDPSAELTPAFWHNVTEVFENNDAAFQTYFALKSRDYSLANCTGTCKTQEICGLRAAQSHYNCATIKPGINLKRTADGGVARSEGTIEIGECEGSLMKPMLARIVAQDGLLERALKEAKSKVT
jgi:sphingomyelin phosphodiesterase